MTTSTRLIFLFAALSLVFETASAIPLLLPTASQSIPMGITKILAVGAVIATSAAVVYVSRNNRLADEVPDATEHFQHRISAFASDVHNSVSKHPMMENIRKRQLLPTHN